MNFDDQLNCLVYYHLQEHSSGRELLQDLEQDDFARSNIAPVAGIKESAFFEAINTRGLEQMEQTFNDLRIQAQQLLPKRHKELGELILIDGTLIDAVLSMEWAKYRDGSKKAKAHVGLDLQYAIPYKVFVTDGNGGERPFVDQILEQGQTE